MNQTKKKSGNLLFSQRIGKKPIKIPIQIDSISDELRNCLWNAFFKYFIEPARTLVDSNYIIEEEFTPFFQLLWENFLKKPVDLLDIDPLGRYYHYQVHDSLKRDFFSWEYIKVYDFIDWIVRTDSPVDISSFIQYCNMILERENSGYRFVGEYLTPITDEVEIKEIETVVQNSDKLGLIGVKTHFESALQLLSNRENPDYKNSFKESISAVESICKKISGKSNATLGDALKVIENKIGLHPALKKGYSAIYGYASSADGVRHGSIDESKLDYDDAKYMLVSCSAFVNYLIVKAQKAGLISNV